MRILMVVMGRSIPKTKIGIRMMNIGYLFFRNNHSDPNFKSLRITDLISFGKTSGTLLVGRIVTDWFDLDPQKDNWVYNINALIGRNIEVELKGLQILRGEKDIKITVYDKYNQPKELFNICCIKAKGIQLSDINLRGRIQLGTLDSRRNSHFDRKK